MKCKTTFMLLALGLSSISISTAGTPKPKSHLKNTVSKVSVKLPETVSSEVILSPIADAFVQDGNANVNVNFGKAPKLILKNDAVGTNRESYMKFELKRRKNFESAILRLYIISCGVKVASTNWEIYYVPNDDWSETEITWNNKPRRTKLLATIGGKKSGWAEWDISDVLKELDASDKTTVSLCIVSTLKSPQAPVDLSSNEDPDKILRPQLVLSR